MATVVVPFLVVKATLDVSPVATTMGKIKHPKIKEEKKKIDEGLVAATSSKVEPLPPSLCGPFFLVLSAGGTISLGKGHGGGKGSVGQASKAFPAVRPTSWHILAKSRASIPNDRSIATNKETN